MTALKTYATIHGVTCKVLTESPDSDYDAAAVLINGALWHVRTAKNTAKKPGAFLAFWRKDAAGENVPYDVSDVANGLLVFVDKDDQRGVFVFTPEHLNELGITTGMRKGKRGFRVYPPWCEGLNAHAARTQRAQACAFHRY